MTLRTQPMWLDNLAKVLGSDKVRGARAHLEHDQDDNHLDFVWEVLSKMVTTEKDEAKMFAHVHGVYQLFCMYFRELYELTAGRRDGVTE
ncbi:MAG: hypothetical protein QM820_34030 [Minicystis sp.]